MVLRMIMDNLGNISPSARSSGGDDSSATHTPTVIGFDESSFKLENTPTTTMAPLKFEDPLNTPRVTSGGRDLQTFFPSTSEILFEGSDTLPQITGKLFS